MKGFTLVELLAVILLIGIVGTIAYQGVSTAIKESKKNSYNTQVNNIISATKNWALENIEVLPETLDETYELSLEKLKQSGNLSNKDIIDSRDNSVMNGCIIITCSSNCKQYNYVYEERDCTNTK